MKHVVLSFAILSLYRIYAVNIDSDISSFVQQLSLQEKIGQLFIVAAATDEEFSNLHKPYRTDKDYVAQLITEYNIGGIIWLGKSRPEDQKARTALYQEINCTNKIPLWFAQDLEPSFMERFGMPTLPNAAILGIMPDTDLTEITGRTTARIAQHLGVQIILAPVADLHIHQENGITTQRSFGSDPHRVAEHVTAFVQGIHENGLIACVKHFPGHGHTNTDSHQALPVVTLTRNELEESAFIPFKRAIQIGVDAVMLGHIAVPDLDPTNCAASISKTIVTEILRNQLCFDGLIISDALDMKALGSQEQAPLHALLAGCDILLCPHDVTGTVADIKQALVDGRLSIQELDEHVARIIAAKKRLLFF